MRWIMIGALVLCAGCTAQEWAFGLSLVTQQALANQAAFRAQQAASWQALSAQRATTMDPTGSMAPRVIQSDGTVTTGFQQ